MMQQATMWKGDIYILELYEGEPSEDLGPVTQVQAVCLYGWNEIVSYKYIEDFEGFPGGSIENGETPEETLRRELYEEARIEITRCGLMGYIKSYPEYNPEDIKVQLRYWARVSLLEETPDPDGKSLGRVIMPADHSYIRSGWGGKINETLIEWALIKERVTP